jgi:4,5-dihydroxyphthalate decarboxylase
MNKPQVTAVLKDYDHLAPLACGDVVAEGIDLTLDRDTAGAIDRVREDPSIQVGEHSFSNHLIRLSRGDRSWVGIPVFPTRAFRQRCFFVLRDSGLSDLKDLAGKRVATNGWPDTGNTWSRALLREQGVRIDQIRWWVGSVEGPPSGRPLSNFPPYVQAAPTGRSLRQMLLDGEIDALMCPWPPSGFYDPNSPFVRLIPDYRQAEQEYVRRTGIFPIHHIMAIRRELFEREPAIALSLYHAFDESKRHWDASRRRLAETTPWLLADIEDATALIGEDWWPYGIEANRHVIRALCEEELAQGLVERPIDPDSVFAEFAEVASRQAVPV